MLAPLLGSALLGAAAAVVLARQAFRAAILFSAAAALFSLSAASALLCSS